jgi:hypothetical protein
MLGCVLLMETPPTVLGVVYGHYGPSGTLAVKPAGRCGAFSGFEAVEMSKVGVAESSPPLAHHHHSWDGNDVAVSL